MTDLTHALTKAIFNGKKINQLGLELLEYGRIYGRDVVFVPDYRNKLQEMAALKEELEQLDREFGMTEDNPVHQSP